MQIKLVVVVVVVYCLCQVFKSIVYTVSTSFFDCSTCMAGFHSKSSLHFVNFPRIFSNQITARFCLSSNF